jgi:HNH endonuclease
LMAQTELLQSSIDGKPKYNGVVRFLTPWDVVRPEILPANDKSIELMDSWNRVLQIDSEEAHEARLQVDSEEAQAARLNLSALAPRREVRHRLGKQLWTLRNLEEYCPLVQINIDGTEVRGKERFLYRRGYIWASDTDLSANQWKAGIDEYAVVSNGTSDGGLTAERRVSVEVRRAVWRRDSGRCVVCGSRERLEYDHIIPVSLGGSNTERNIELLCEVHNRSKSNNI